MKNFDEILFVFTYEKESVAFSKLKNYSRRFARTKELTISAGMKS